MYGLFIYNKWRGMGTLNSIDVIDQHYELQLDLFESSYASLCTETIERSMEEMKFRSTIMTYSILYLLK